MKLHTTPTTLPANHQIIAYKGIFFCLEYTVEMSWFLEMKHPFCFNVTAIPFEPHPHTSRSIITGQWLNSNRKGCYTNHWRLQIKMTSPERLWEEEGAALWLGNNGILGLNTVGRHSGRNLEPVFPWRGNSYRMRLLSLLHCVHWACLLSYVLASHTDKLTKFLHVCNYCLLRNAVFPSAVSLGLALSRVLLSILL